MKKPEDEDMLRKRKINQNCQIPCNVPHPKEELEEDEDFLSLSLCLHPVKLKHSSSSTVQPKMPPPLTPPSPITPPQPLTLPPQLFSPTVSVSPDFPPSPLMQKLMSEAPPQKPLQLSPTHPIYVSLQQAPPSKIQKVYVSNTDVAAESSSQSVRIRRKAPQSKGSETIPAPFPWATNYRARVHSLKYLLQRQIVTITGQVQCKRCERQYEMGFDLRDKFDEVGTFIAENKRNMFDRAPNEWNNPILPTCKHCNQENSVKPVISTKKRSINWLFLLLGQMLGCCTLEQLKYFCKHTQNHRTGAKDRVLYLAYLAICKQLDPAGPFAVHG